MADEPTRPSCRSCAYHDADLDQCHRWAPNPGDEAGWPAVEGADWCGQHPAIEAMFQRHMQAQGAALFSEEYVRKVLATLNPPPQGNGG